MREVEASLNAGVENYTVEGWVGLGDTVPCYYLLETEVGGKAYLSASAGIAFRSVMSNFTVETLSLPCFLTRSSRFSCRRPRAMT